ncbi:MAG: glycosyltransferase family 4 protein [Bryobacteraceae bacterium]|nr:glycosyltransferase family 4 protein [Bryobacteraceae bacterium]
MKIALIGGIYGQPGYIKLTPETTLEAGLREAGHTVTPLSHYEEADFSAFDVVHVHHLSYGAPRLASDPTGTPFVFTAHNGDHMSGVPMGVARELAMRYVISRADAVVALSRSEADFQRRTYRLDGAEHVSIPNGIDAVQFPYARRNAANREGKPWQLLFVAQLIPIKGCDLMLHALARLPQDAELTFAYQNGAMEPALRELAATLNISKRVKFAGKQSPAQLAELYQTSDLFVLPSDTEALPSVITESMLSGLPFIARPVGGVVEQTAGFGRILQERSAEALAHEISDVLENYAHFADRSAEMSDYARRTYSIPQMIASHLELYRSLAGRKPRRAKGTLTNAVIRAAVHRFGRAGSPFIPPVTSAERL